MVWVSSISLPRAAKDNDSRQTMDNRTVCISDSATVLSGTLALTPWERIRRTLNARCTPGPWLSGSADWQSAVSPIGNRQVGEWLGAAYGLPTRDTADCQSAPRTDRFMEREKTSTPLEHSRASRLLPA